MSFLAVSPQFLLTVFVLGLATYGSRVAGYWLLRGVTVTGRWKAAMDAVPPAILTAVIAPNVFLEGPAEMLAGAVALGVALLRAPLLITIASGMASVVLFRYILSPG